MRTRSTTAVLAALPATVLGVAGLTHPVLLTPATAARWWQLHVWLLPVFPLLPAALLLPLRGHGSLCARAARVCGYLFAVGYTALDVLDGIGAGLVVETGRHPVDPTVLRMFRVGDRLGHVGIGFLMAAAILVGVALWAPCGPWVLPGVVVYVIGCRVFWFHHIFRPDGVAAMFALAVGGAAIALAPRRRA